TYFFVRRHRIAVVHVHNFFYTASPAVFWAAKAAGAKTVMTMHNYRLFCLNALFFREGKHCMICVQEGRFKQGIEHRCFKSSTLFSWALAGSINFHKWLGTWHHRVDRFIVINPLMQQLLSGMNIPTNKVLFKPNFLPGQA
ncbi:glycosyltransferase, partial|uniref:glycosyltransferase n=1 Tax=Escherichia coli TaxID=562 RepID=UPI0014447E02